MKQFVILLLSLCACNLAYAQLPPFTGTNYSGTYLCKGENQKIGSYQVSVTLRLNLVTSHRKFGAYEYTAETENAVKFYGNAVIVGNQLAASYYLDTVKRKGEPTTALATIKRVSAGRWSFLSSYFEPDDFGGNYGTENCMMIKPKVTPKKSNN